MQVKNMEQAPNKKILSDITVHMKYAKFKPELLRRETWEEICERNMNMHIKKYPMLEQDIRDVYAHFVLPKLVLPSMRSMQFAGKPIDISPNRVYNCAYMPIDSHLAFSEAMFLLLGGTGVGYSVQRHHVEQLPELVMPNPDRQRRYLIADSIEGWADAVKILLECYMGIRKSTPIFDYSDIREKGALLITSGGKAPGSQPLRECLVKIEGILQRCGNYQLNPIYCHDIMCHIADAVLSGGIRRAAMISLFSADDMGMIAAKSGKWWENNPQRGRANNSAVLLRHRITKDYFLDLWNRIKASGSGEPGIYFNNDKDWGTNPCCEIALRPYQFCNLTEVNASNVKDQADLEARVSAGAFLGTLQAGYTDFHYLREIWRKNTEKDALLGVSMTGIAANKVAELDLHMAAIEVVNENKRVAEIIGIKPAARTTCIKPAGTTSLVLGTSSGIHAYHDEYYIRRLRVGKNEAIYDYLAKEHPSLIEDEYFKPHEQAVISVPQQAPLNAITRNESVFDLLERIKEFSISWVRAGHKDGLNTHNVSATVSIKEDEWESVGDWFWLNRHYYNGLSVLPFDGGTYTQAPFETCDKDKFEELSGALTNVDLTKVIETQDNTDLSGELACAGGSCEI
jgi:ribonucleoside-diphosphate reductase alpha chain|tara:strand:- start:2999 stop:4876 length:1878 start_codon:yes stop_codon:yes gene_type:complete